MSQQSIDYAPSPDEPYRGQTNPRIAFPSSKAILSLILPPTRPDQTRLKLTLPPIPPLPAEYLSYPPTRLHPHLELNPTRKAALTPFIRALNQYILRIFAPCPRGK